MSIRYIGGICAALLATVALSSPSSAQLQYDTPDLTHGISGFGKTKLIITAGPSGAPEGFTVWWMTRQEFDEYGATWPEYPIAQEGVASFTGAPTLNTADGAYSSFQLGPNQSIEVEIGDLFDETGCALGGLGDLDLTSGTEYVFCAYANGEPGYSRSGLTVTVQTATDGPADCTFTQGYWKTHGADACHSGNNADAWPPSATPMLLGTVSYTKTELCAIYNTPAGGNGLISLAHQLITAKLNIANGANGASIAATIAAADAQIGALVIPPIGSGFLAPGSTSGNTQALDDFNNGITGPGHCPTPTHASTWGKVKAMYR